MPKTQPMKCYYVMIRFDGPYVSGFLVPQATDEEAALKQLKKSIYLRLVMIKQKAINASNLSDDHPTKLKQFLRSLKRPWRFCGEPRHKGEKKRVSGRECPVVEIVELSTPSHAGFWLKDILLGKEHCNLPTTWEPRPR